MSVTTLKTNRRTLFAIIVGSLLASHSPTTNAQDGRSTPPSDAVPAAVDLGSDIWLVDYRFITSRGITMMIGEIKNESGQAVDAPVIGLTFYDAEGNIVASHYATPKLAFFEDGDASPIQAEFYEFDPLQDNWDRVEFFYLW
jgi:hypothetical protein